MTMSAPRAGMLPAPTPPSAPGRCPPRARGDAPNPDCRARRAASVRPARGDAPGIVVRESICSTSAPACAGMRPCLETLVLSPRASASHARGCAQRDRDDRGWATSRQKARQI
ncbi:hypothetical protein DFR70_102769 [Nocardia tenerifensis]|uniref:Uncharacterized protein n=1 Tax=Nocardia tenerifensis TaxID=228006 RepID=A0A318KBE9_9NOCA|nr:hypothetical protein DFR70_102769 [Nocardia tenerifensis]